MTPLDVPPAAVRDSDSVQMLSAWIAEKGLHCSLKLGMWGDNGRDEPRAWGILLADAIRHVAHGLSDRYDLDVTDTISKVLSSLQDELDDPTSDTTGGFSHGPS